MPDFRVEAEKEGLQGFLPRDEVWGGGGDGREARRAACNAVQGQIDAIHGGVGCEPVFSLDAGDQGPQSRTQPVRVAIEGLVNFSGEFRNCPGVVARPVLIEEVVEVDVDDDAGKAPPLRCEEEAGLVEDGVTVCKAVDVAVHHDALHDGRWESFADTRRGAFLEVAKEVANARGVTGTCEREMSEEVHSMRGCKLSGALDNSHHRMMVWLDGEWKEEGAALVSCADRAFLRGEGIFETVLGLGGRPFGWAEHWSRLQAGAEAFGLALPSCEEGLGIACELLLRNGLTGTSERARLRVTRTPGHFLYTAVAEVIPAEPERVRIGRFVRNERSALVGLKAISYGENSLALAWGRSQGATEVLLPNTLGDWCEGTWSNVFAVVEGEVLTPPLTSGCLPGVTRGRVIELACSQGLAVREVAKSVAWLGEAGELFLTSSLRGVRPVEELDGRPLAVGRITAQLAQLLSEAELQAGW